MHKVINVIKSFGYMNIHYLWFTKCIFCEFNPLKCCLQVVFKDQWLIREKIKDLLILKHKFGCRDKYRIVNDKTLRLQNTSSGVNQIVYMLFSTRALKIEYHHQNYTNWIQTTRFIWKIYFERHCTQLVILFQHLIY